MKLFAILVFSSLIFITCKKKNTNEEEKPVVLTGETSKKSYNLYEIGSISFSNKLAQGTLIAATVNGSPSKVAVVNDSLVAFSIFPPAYRVGSNEIKFESGGQTIKALFTVTASVAISDPQVYFDSFIAAQQADVTLMQSVFNDDSSKLSSKDLKLVLEQTNIAINTFKTQWASLSTIDKQSLANYLEANKPAFAAYTQGAQDLLSYTQDNQNGLNRQTGINGIICATGAIPEKYKCLASAIKSQLKEVIGYGTLAAIAGSTIPVTGWAGLAVAAVPSALGAPAFIRLSFVSARFVRYHFYIGKVVAYNLFTMVAGRTTGNEIIFAKDQPKPLDFKVQLRNIQPTDLSSSLVWLGELVGVIDVFNSLCDRLGASQFRWKYASISTKEYEALDLSFLSISSITNPNVIGAAIGGTLLAPTLKFSSTSSDEQLFKFDLLYNDGVNKSIKVTVEAILKPFNYKVGFIDATPVPETQLAFSKNESRFFTLINENNTSATGINYSLVSISGITNPNVTVVANNVGGSTFSIRLNSALTTSQTTSFDVLYQNQKVQTLNAIVDDSVAVYKASIVGNWKSVINLYCPSPCDLAYTAFETFEASGLHLFTKRENPNGTFEIYNPPISSSWTVVGDNVNGYRMKQGFYTTERLTYPVTQMTYKQPGGGYVFSYTKQ